MKEAMIYLVKDAFTTSLTICKGLYAYLGTAILKMYAFLALLALAISLYTHNIHDLSVLVLGIVQSVSKISAPLALASLLLFGVCFAARLALTSLAFAGRVLR